MLHINRDMVHANNRHASLRTAKPRRGDFSRDLILSDFPSDRGTVRVPSERLTAFPSRDQHDLFVSVTRSKTVPSNN
jgi:hypothetical protein